MHKRYGNDSPENGPPLGRCHISPPLSCLVRVLIGNKLTRPATILVLTGQCGLAMIELLVQGERLASGVTDQEDAHEPPSATSLHFAANAGLPSDVPSFPHEASAPHPCVSLLLARQR
jgi:hypothetical protein